MGQKISVSLDDDELDVPEVTSDDTSKRKPTVKDLTADLPSPHKAKVAALKAAPRVQLNFTNIPAPIKDAFTTEAQKRGMGMKEFLFHCFRAGGVDLPAYEEIDGRRR